MEREQKLQELKELIQQITDEVPIYKIQELIQEYHRILGL